MEEMQHWRAALDACVFYAGVAALAWLMLAFLALSDPLLGTCWPAWAGW